jgi:ribokinase
MTSTMKPTPRGIVVLGSVNTDLVLNCAQLPLPGQTVLGDSFSTLIGGKGANQAVAAARLGAPVAFIGCVGDDGFGRTARDLLAAEGIDTTHLHTIAGTTTGVAMILVERSGQNCIALAAGANAALCPAHVEAAAALIQGAAMLICQLESPLEAVQRAIAIAHAANVMVLLNPAPVQPLPPSLLAHVDVLVPNETEAAALIGLPPAAPFDAAQGAARLHRLGPRTVIVTLGSAGALVSDAAGAMHLDAPRVQAVDTTGAGDTFIGAFAAAHCAGAGVHEAIAHGQQAAALSVTRAGAMASMPRADELPPLTAASHRP